MASANPGSTSSKYKNKVVYGTTVLVDLTADTVTESTLKKGATAHDASGKAITGTLTVPAEQSKTVDLSMPSGNQVITPDNGKVLSQATIMKPSTLLPENIKKGVNIGGVVGMMGCATETWVWNDEYDGETDITLYGNFVSNGENFNLISISYSTFATTLKYGSKTICMIELTSDKPVFQWNDNPAYRKITFLESPAGDLLTYLKANATKQPADAALQPSKSVTITENGTTTITPDIPYDGIQSVEIITNVASSGGGDIENVWLLGDDWGVDEFEITISFKSNGKLYSKISRAFGKRGYSTYYDDTQVKLDSISGLADYRYSILLFNENPTGDLLAWLNSIGTKISECI